MEPTYPVGYISPQPQTGTIITPDNTLVDDPVKLVDDTTALVGSLVTPAQIRSSFRGSTPRSAIFNQLNKASINSGIPRATINSYSIRNSNQNIIGRGYIDSQPQTITSITPDGTLVDDPVKLVDDTGALVGSQVTPIAIRSTVQANLPKGSVTIRR